MPRKLARQGRKRLAGGTAEPRIEYVHKWSGHAGEDRHAHELPGQRGSIIEVKIISESLVGQAEVHAGRTRLQRIGALGVLQSAAQVLHPPPNQGTRSRPSLILRGKNQRPHQRGMRQISAALERGRPPPKAAKVKTASAAAPPLHPLPHLCLVKSSVHHHHHHHHRHRRQEPRECQTFHLPPPPGGWKNGGAPPPPPPHPPGGLKGGGPPPPPPPPGMGKKNFAAPARVPLAGKKMKALHWQKLHKTKTKKTVWGRPRGATLV